MDRKELGAHTELQCITYLHGLGYTISIPWGDNARYDFILEVNGKLYKMQCKTSHLKQEGVYEFITCRRRINRNENVRLYYKEDEVDFFVTFIKEKCYLIPFNETSKTQKTLRFIPPANNTKYTPIETYLAENQISKLLNQ